MNSRVLYFIGVPTVSTTCLVNHHLRSTRNASIGYITEIEELYHKLPTYINNDRIDQWHRDAIATQENWLNKPFYKRLGNPPPPPCLDIILELKLPINEYYKPINL